MKRILACLFVMIPVVLGMTGCSLFDDLTPPEVVSVSPCDGAVNVGTGCVISVAFSKPMEQPVTEKAFSLKKSGILVEGYFSWSPDDKTMSFTPYSGLKGGGIYDAVLSISAEDKRGMDLSKGSSFSFSTGAETVKPFVVSVKPACGATGISRTSNVRLVFSKPVNPASLINGLIFNPAFDYSVTSDTEQNLILLTPVQPWQSGVTYLGTANPDIVDFSGNHLLGKYSFSFTVGQVMSNAVLTGIRNAGAGPFWSTSSINQGVEKDDQIHFVFSRAMSVNGTSGYVTFSPSIQGSFQWIGKGEAVFSPDNGFELDRIYSVSVSASMPDSFGNELGSPVSCVFRINGIDSMPPSVLCVSNGSSSPWIDQQFTTLNPDATISNLSMVFSNPMNETRTSLALTVEYICGSGTTGVTLTRIDWSSDDRVMKIRLGGLDSANTYRIKINSGREGALDKKGNWLLNDYTLHFRT